MSRKLQLCASPCLDQMLHKIQWSQHLPPMCSAVTQPSCPAGHHVSQSPHVGPAEAPQLVCLFVCLSVRLSVCLFHAKTGSCKQLDLGSQAICQPLSASSWTVHASAQQQLWFCKGTSWAVITTANMNPLLRASICDAPTHRRINIPVGPRAHFTHPLTNTHITCLVTKGLITYLFTKGPK